VTASQGQTDKVMYMIPATHGPGGYTHPVQAGPANIIANRPLAKEYMTVMADSDAGYDIKAALSEERMSGWIFTAYDLDMETGGGDAGWANPNSHVQEAIAGQLETMGLADPVPFNTDHAAELSVLQALTTAVVVEGNKLAVILQGHSPKIIHQDELRFIVDSYLHNVLRCIVFYDLVGEIDIKLDSMYKRLANSGMLRFLRLGELALLPQASEALEFAADIARQYRQLKTGGGKWEYLNVSAAGFQAHSNIPRSVSYWVRQAEYSLLSTQLEYSIEEYLSSVSAVLFPARRDRDFFRKFLYITMADGITPRTQLYAPDESSTVRFFSADWSRTAVTELRPGDNLVKVVGEEGYLEESEGYTTAIIERFYQPIVALGPKWYEASNGRYNLGRKGRYMPAQLASGDWVGVDFGSIKSVLPEISRDQVALELGGMQLKQLALNGFRTWEMSEIYGCESLLRGLLIAGNRVEERVALDIISALILDAFKNNTVCMSGEPPEEVHELGGCLRHIAGPPPTLKELITSGKPVLIPDAELVCTVEMLNAMLAGEDYRGHCARRGEIVFIHLDPNGQLLEDLLMPHLGLNLLAAVGKGMWRHGKKIFRPSQAWQPEGKLPLVAEYGMGADRWKFKVPYQEIGGNRVITTMQWSASLAYYLGIGVTNTQMSAVITSKTLSGIARQLVDGYGVESMGEAEKAVARRLNLQPMLEGMAVQGEYTCYASNSEGGTGPILDLPAVGKRTLDGRTMLTPTIEAQNAEKSGQMWGMSLYHMPVKGQLTYHDAPNAGAIECGIGASLRHEQVDGGAPGKNAGQAPKSGSHLQVLWEILRRMGLWFEEQCASPEFSVDIARP
jgi:hypothetical protein